MKSLIFRTFFTLSILLTLCSCQTIEVRGQSVDDDLLPQLKNKKLNKSEVEDLIGTPTIIASYTPNVWYYIQRSLAYRAWFVPKVIEQRIVKVIFNNNNTIEEVVVLDNLHKDDIHIINEETKTYGTELNFIQKFVKNLGRFNQTTTEKNRRR